jgi:hypothetical protein
MTLRAIFESFCMVRLSRRDPVIANLDTLLHQLLNQGKRHMATTKERLGAMNDVLDEIRSDIAELKAKVAAGLPQEDFEAELSALEAKLGSAAADYTADPVVEPPPPVEPDPVP